MAAMQAEKTMDSAENSALEDRPRRETIRQYKGTD
jgi:hypothetical protein